jgi:tetratricopeptide (TPR) repeat protein
MLKQLSLIFALFTLCLFSCDNPKNYTLEELEKNHYNALEVRVDPALDAEGYKRIFEDFQALNKEDILKRLSSKGLELHRASFGLYYLANAYAAEKDMDNAVKYHKIAAEHYLNPQSLLKLAELNFHVRKDYPKAYKYLHQSLEITVEITANNRSHPVAKNGKDKAQFLLQEMDRMGERGAFDKTAVREQLKIELTPLMDKYREIYGLGPRESS